MSHQSAPNSQPNELITRNCISARMPHFDDVFFLYCCSCFCFYVLNKIRVFPRPALHLFRAIKKRSHLCILYIVDCVCGCSLVNIQRCVTDHSREISQTWDLLFPRYAQESPTYSLKLCYFGNE